MHFDANKINRYERMTIVDFFFFLEGKVKRGKNKSETVKFHNYKFSSALLFLFTIHPSETELN